MRKFQISTLRKNNVKLRPVLSIKKVSQTFIYQEFGRVLIGLVSKFFVVKNVKNAATDSLSSNGNFFRQKGCSCRK